MDYTDIRYEVEAPVATVTIDRPDRMNAFRGRTIEELLHAFKRAWADKSVDRKSHTSELQSLMRISYAVFCLKQKIKDPTKISIRSIQTHNKQIEQVVYKVRTPQ